MTHIFFHCNNYLLFLNILKNVSVFFASNTNLQFTIFIVTSKNKLFTQFKSFFISYELYIDQYAIYYLVNFKTLLLLKHPR